MASVPVSMPADEVFCLRCGYNLRGIPEDRCPECGFGYQLAAIRFIVAASFERRLAKYQRMLRFAAISLLCSLLVLASQRGLIGGLLPTAFRSAVCGIELWLLYCAVCWVPIGAARFDSPGKLLAALFLLPALLAVGLAFPILPKAVAAISLLAPPALSRRLPVCIDHADLSLQHKKRRRLRFWRLAGWMAMTIALAALIAVHLACH
jgi:hypothetical protein